MKFKELELEKQLLKGIKDAGFEECLPVQEQTLVHSLKKKDVCVQSQTGTGKTAAFLITIFQIFLKNKKSNKALIIVPTRELAVQIEKEAKLIGRYLSFNIGCFYGGVGYDKQKRTLKKDVHLIIATPGRLLDFVQQKIIDISDTEIFVIDEADRLLDMGFYPDLRRIFKSLTDKSRQTMLFSATLTGRTLRMASEFMNDSVQIDLSTDTITVENVTQYQYHVGKSDKIRLLLGILKEEKPKNVLIFTNTKREASRLCAKLELNDIDAKFIMGDLPQRKRQMLINRFKEGKIKILIATDVASRGLHVDDLDLVVNYDMPENPENYVHRIGRTARAGKKGKAITLTCQDFVYGLEAIEDCMQMKIPTLPVEQEMLLEDKSKGHILDYLKTKGRNARNKNRSGRYQNKYSSNKPPQRSKQETHFSHKRSRTPKKPIPKLKKGGTQEERMEYYRLKYGDDFKA